MFVCRQIFAAANGLETRWCLAFPRVCVIYFRVHFAGVTNMFLMIICPPLALWSYLADNLSFSQPCYKTISCVCQLSIKNNNYDNYEIAQRQPRKTTGLFSLFLSVLCGFVHTLQRQISLAAKRRTAWRHLSKNSIAPARSSIRACQT